MNSMRLVFVIGFSALAGCVTSPPVELPVEARGVALTPVSSDSVTVREPLLRKREGGLELVGFVAKVYGSKTTENTHLDVSFISTTGETLRRQTARFSPQRLVRGRHAPNRQASYAVPVEVLPAGTARIEVRAHDADEHQP